MNQSLFGDPNNIKDEDIDNLLERYSQTQGQLKALERLSDVDDYIATKKAEEALKGRIRKMLAFYHPQDGKVESVSVTFGNVTATLKEIVKVNEVFDMERFKKNHPMLYMEYVDIKQSSTLVQNLTTAEKERG